MDNIWRQTAPAAQCGAAAPLTLLWQGCMLYELIPNMPEHRLLPLMQRFAEMLAQSGLFCGSLSETK